MSVARSPSSVRPNPNQNQQRVPPGSKSQRWRSIIKSRPPVATTPERAASAEPTHRKQLPIAIGQGIEYSLSRCTPSPPRPRPFRIAFLVQKTRAAAQKQQNRASEGQNATACGAAHQKAPGAIHARRPPRRSGTARSQAGPLHRTQTPSGNRPRPGRTTETPRPLERRIFPRCPRSGRRARPKAGVVQGFWGPRERPRSRRTLPETSCLAVFTRPAPHSIGYSVWWTTSPVPCRAAGRLHTHTHTHTHLLSQATRVQRISRPSLLSHSLLFY